MARHATLANFEQLTSIPSSFLRRFFRSEPYFQGASRGSAHLRKYMQSRTQLSIDNNVNDIFVGKLIHFIELQENFPYFILNNILEIRFFKLMLAFEMY